MSASHLITSMKIKRWAIHRGGRAEGWNCVECNQRSCNQKPAPVADIRIHSVFKVRLTYHLCNSLLIFSYNPPVQNKSTSIIYFSLYRTLLLRKSFLTGRATVAVWIFLFIWSVHPVSGIIVCVLDVTPHPKLMNSLTNTKPCFKEQQSALLRGLITPLQHTHINQSVKWSKRRLIHTNWAAASWTHNHLLLSETKVSAQYLYFCLRNSYRKPLLKRVV